MQTPERGGARAIEPRGWPWPGVTGTHWPTATERDQRKLVSEWENLDLVTAIGEAIAEHGERFYVYLSVLDAVDEDTVTSFNDTPIDGPWDSPGDFVEQRWIELNETNKGNPLFSYVDWERAWHGDHECNGWMFVHIHGTGHGYAVAPS